MKYNEFMHNTQAKWRITFYSIVMAVLGVIFVGWWQGSGADVVNGTQRLIAIGRLFGLLAAFSILLEVVLMSRLPFMERNFGMEETITLHRLNGYGVLLSISGHVGFLVVGYATRSKAGYLAQYLDFVKNYEDVLAAAIGTTIFFLATGLSVQLVRKKMRYEWWYATHLFIYLAILLTFGHQIKVGADLLSIKWFQYFWINMYVWVFGLLAWYRFLQPIFYMYWYDLRLARVVPEAEGINSYYISGKNLSKLKYKSGQYVTWRFAQWSTILHAHPFSISSQYGSEYIRFSAKALGDYSSGLNKLGLGTRVVFDGPRGAFHSDNITTDSVIMVAGGIGIAPFMGIIPTLLEQKKQVTLVYCTKTIASTAFVAELDKLKANGLKVSLLVSDQGAKHPDINALKDLGANSTTTVMVCGPDGLSKAMIAAGKELRLPKRQILSERFVM
jgi:predicted ferric reductase